MEYDTEIILNFIDKKSNRNKITTTKYNVITFIPKFLFYQYIQPSNIYYLINAIAGFIVYVVSPMSNVLPILFVLAISAFREILEDVGRYQQDKLQNNKMYQILRENQKILVKSQDIQQGDILYLQYNDEVPADSILLQIDDPTNVLFVSTVQLDGESNLKRRYSLKKEINSKILVQTMYNTPDMSTFNGIYDNTTQFNIDNTIIKGMSIKSSCSVTAAVLFTGKQTKIMSSQVKPKNKQSKQTLRLIKIIMIQALISIILMFLLPFLSISVYKSMKDKPFFSEEPSTYADIFAQKCIIYFIVLAYFLPISLFVSIEVVRMIITYQFNLDRSYSSQIVKNYIQTHGQLDLKDEVFTNCTKSQLSAMIKNSAIFEELFEVDVIFSDKTGTLTLNDMVLKYTCNDTTVYDIINQSQIPEVQIFMLAISNTLYLYENTIQGESLDEISFLKGVEKFGMKLISRNSNIVEYSYNLNIIQYEILVVIPFTSDRKKMSIVLREISTQFTPIEITQPNKPFILTKGADDKMKQISVNSSIGSLEKHITQFSQQGLRTLVFSCKQLDECYFNLWIEEFKHALNYGELSTEYISCVEKIENNLIPIMATAVEDKLQDNLQQTLQSFQTAGIQLWMLTGDKNETALSIGYTSGLMPVNQQILNFTTSNISAENLSEQLLIQQLTQRQDTFHNIQKQVSKFSSQYYIKRNVKHFRPLIYDQQYSILIDGYTLDKLQQIGLIHIFFYFAISSSSIIACRLTPSQKAMIVKEIKRINTNITTLAVGDGNNDVPMIKQADIGVGIAGKEGMLACNNADITFTQFSHLQKAIFVHGRYTHSRFSELIEYNIYRNSIIPIVTIIYSFYDKFTVNVFFDSLLLLFYNLLIQNFPILFQTFTTKDINENLLLDIPRLFKQNKEKQRINYSSVYVRVGIALYQAIIIMVITSTCFGYGMISNSGQNGDFNCALQFVFISLLSVTTMEFFIYNTYYTYFTLAAIILLIFITACAMLFGNYSTLFGTTQVGSVIFLSNNLQFYLTFFCTALLSIIPSLLYKLLQKFYFPNTTDLAQFYQKI